MISRIRHVMVTVAKPFLLTNLEQPIPAGRYQITTEEEPLGDSIYSAYRRISATIRLGFSRCPADSCYPEVA